MPSRCAELALLPANSEGRAAAASTSDLSQRCCCVVAMCLTCVEYMCLRFVGIIYNVTLMCAARRQRAGSGTALCSTGHCSSGGGAHHNPCRVSGGLGLATGLGCATKVSMGMRGGLLVRFDHPDPRPPPTTPRPIEASCCANPLQC